jgi:hypothetical protein
MRTQRAEAVRDLVEMRVPVDQAVAALTRFPWDSDDELHILTRADALRVLNRHKHQELTTADCRNWASALEGREDLGLEAEHEDTLKEFLFQLATPELAEPLTPEVVTQWESTLS